MKTKKVELDVDFIGGQTSLTKEEEKTISEYIKKNKSKKHLIINWYYEASDEDALDIGKEFESLLEIPFEFIVHT